MGILIVIIALGAGWYLYGILEDEMRRARYREARRDWERRRWEA